MQTAPSTKPAIPAIYGTLLFLALICAGLAGNYFKFELFLNIDFLFGSIFAMIALQYFGLGRGIAAAAIIASYTYILLNHPYAIVTMTSEVAVVGWLMSRRKIGMVLADTLYWLFVGIPLVYLFYHVVMHVPFDNTTISMAKQTINGISNALVARLIFTGYTLYSRTSQISYREIVNNLLAFFVLCPALIMLAVSSRGDFKETDALIRTSLITDCRRLDKIMHVWVVNRTSTITTLAGMAAAKTPQQMMPYLEMATTSDANFQDVGLMNGAATAIAYFPLLDELGQQNIGKDFADRPYISRLKETLKPSLSEVTLGKTGNHKPRVAMLAPVIVHGAYGGYVLGVLSLEQTQELLNIFTEHNATLYTLIDKNGNVIMTNRSDQKVMTQYVRGKGTLNHLDDIISQWMPVVTANTPLSERWKQSFYVAEISIGELAEWRLILEQPVAPFQKALYDNYTGKLILLFLVLLGSLVLAELLSRRIMVTLENLRQITRDLPVRLASGANIDWPESGIQEASHLINNTREMADTITQGYHSRLIAMRDLISAIAHQWRQPLATLGMIIQRTYAVGTTQHLTPEYLDEFKANAMRQVRYMSETIDEFRNFYSPDKQMTSFSPLNCINDAVRLLEAQFTSSGITVHVQCRNCDGHLVEGISNEFKQVILNLLGNARDAILESRSTCGEPENGRIEVQIAVQEDRTMTIDIVDNGCGIPDDVASRIFAPHFTTKKESGGTGIGLYMSRMIVEESLRGDLRLIRGHDGAAFRIELPLEKCS